MFYTHFFTSSFRTTGFIKSIIVLCIILLSGCASFQQNAALKKYSPDKGYRFKQIDAGNNSDDLFVIVTFSGGGTRAAAFSYGIMQALKNATIEWQGEQKSLLDEVDVISSISGGSFTAAYYGAFGNRIFEDYESRFLRRKVQSDLVKSYLSPPMFFKILFSQSFDRTDMAAEYYDREIFDGATYQDIINRNTRPYIVLNATDMTLGQQFSFIQDTFDLMCSDLASIPVARAAASSSAFPGLLTPLTYQNYAGSCDYQQPSWVARAIKDHDSRINLRRTANAELRLSYANQNKRPFIHLIDGGVADNIGLRAPLNAMNSINHPWSVLRLMNRGKIKKLAVIVVNAGTNPDSTRDKSADVPGLIDTIGAAATVPLDNYSLDTIELLRHTVKQFNSGAQTVKDCEAVIRKMNKPECELNLPEPPNVEFYAIEVAFDYIKDAGERHYFKNLPTTFELKGEVIDKLKTVGKKLLKEDPEYQRLMGNLQ